MEYWQPEKIPGVLVTWGSEIQSDFRVDIVSSCFLGNSLGMKKISVLIIKSQWYLTASCLPEKYSDIIYYNRILKGH